MMRSVWWEEGAVHILDQTRLPQETIILECTDYREVARAIRTMQIRGAPALGIAAAMGMALAAFQAQNMQKEAFGQFMDRAAAELASTRPTAVNLFWALNEMKRQLPTGGEMEPCQIATLMVAQACALAERDVEVNQCLGQTGASLVPRGGRMLTHCNAGAMATGGYGTALGVARAAWAQQRLAGVIACETRPLLQGARITAWELMQDGIDVTLITDNAAGAIMAQGRVDLVVVGADRIAANGDVVNKIGTYSLALLAQAHGLPFYVAAPCSTIDASLSRGSLITIEERGEEEVTVFAGQTVAPAGVPVMNPAFDLTPAHLVCGIVTELGVVYPPYEESIAQVLERSG